MTTVQTIQIRLSECRQRLNELIGNETRSPEEQAEMETLTAEVSKREPELRAALAAEDDPQEVVTNTGDSETRERAELRSRTGIADFLRAAASGTAVTGAAAEYATEHKVPTVGHIPMTIFERSAPKPETRAITAAPAVDGPLQPTVPYVFERSAANSLGIMMPSVPAGQVQIPKDHDSAPG